MRYSLALFSALLATAAASPVAKPQDVVTVVVTQAAAVTVTAGGGFGGQNGGWGPAPTTEPEVVEAPASSPAPEPAATEEPASSEPASSEPAAAPSGDFAKKMLDEHNRYREMVGAPALEWSDEIATVSQGRADTCFFDHVEGTPYGENLSANPPSDDPIRAVWGWYHEGKDYSGEGSSDFSSTGHFTQVVWKGSTKLGCAQKVCGSLAFPDGEPWSDMNMIVCNYDPAGNFVGNYEPNVPAYVAVDDNGNKI